MKFGSEKYGMLEMKSRKKHMTESNFQIKKKSEPSEKRKTTNTWKY